jgi:hypothetical protein
MITYGTVSGWTIDVGRVTLHSAMLGSLTFLYTVHPPSTRLTQPVWLHPFEFGKGGRAGGG